MSPNLQRYLRSTSASHPNSGATSQARPPSSSAAPAAGAHTTSSHYHWQITISHTHWHSIQPLSLAHHNQPRPLASHPRHDRIACKAAAHFPYFTTQPAPLETAAQTDLLAVHHARHHRRPSGMASSSRATASPKTIKLHDGTTKSHDDIPEDRHERQARRASGRRPCRGVGLRPRALPQHAVSARQRYQRSTTTWGRPHHEHDHRRGRSGIRRPHEPNSPTLDGRKGFTV